MRWNVLIFLPFQSGRQSRPDQDSGQTLTRDRGNNQRKNCNFFIAFFQLFWKLLRRPGGLAPRNPPRGDPPTSLWTYPKKFPPPRPPDRVNVCPPPRPPPGGSYRAHLCNNISQLNVRHAFQHTPPILVPSYQSSLNLTCIQIFRYPENLFFCVSLRNFYVSSKIYFDTMPHPPTSTPLEAATVSTYVIRLGNSLPYSFYLSWPV